MKKSLLSLSFCLINIINLIAQCNCPGNEIRFSESRGFDYDPVEDAVFYNGYNNGRVVKLGDPNGDGWFSGQLGIGTTSPVAKLHISTNVAREALRVYLDGNTTRYLNIWQGSGAGVIDPVGTGMLYLGYDQPTDVYVGLNGGKLAIGTSTSAAKLQTAGSIFANATRTNTIFSGTIGIDNANLIGSEGYWALRTATNNSFNLDVHNSNNPKTALNIEQNGTVNIGGNETLVSGYGSRLNLLGASSNGDHLYFVRYNNGSNQSELRVNIGDDLGQKEDMFVVGTHYWSDGNWYPHFAVQASGNVGIGTTDTQGYKLAVKGKTITEEVVVKLHGNWPDYVFEPSYNLPSLSELEQYIKTNKHLPEVPSASEVKENGLSLGEMNAILLKKVEELTLHLIELKKTDDQLKAQNEILMKRLDQLEK